MSPELTASTIISLIEILKITDLLRAWCFFYVGLKFGKLNWFITIWTFSDIFYAEIVMKLVLFLLNFFRTKLYVKKFRVQLPVFTSSGWIFSSFCHKSKFWRFLHEVLPSCSKTILLRLGTLVLFKLLLDFQIFFL